MKFLRVFWGGPIEIIFVVELKIWGGEKQKKRKRKNPEGESIGATLIVMERILVAEIINKVFCREKSGVWVSERWADLQRTWEAVEEKMSTYS